MSEAENFPPYFPPTAGVETEAQWEHKNRDQTHFITELQLNREGQVARLKAEHKGFSKTFEGIEHVEINGTVRVVYRDGVLSVRGGLKAHAHDNLLLVYSHD